MENEHPSNIHVMKAWLTKSGFSRDIKNVIMGISYISDGLPFRAGVLNISVLVARGRRLYARVHKWGHKRKHKQGFNCVHDAKWPRMPMQCYDTSESKNMCTRDIASVSGVCMHALANHSYSPVVGHGPKIEDPCSRE